MTLSRSKLWEKCIAALEGAKGPAEDGTFTALCPFHPDGQGQAPHAANLKLWPPIEGSSYGGFNCAACGEKGGLFVLAERLGIESKKSTEPRGTIVTAYPYADADGRILFEVVRLDPKGFRQRRPDGKGGWTWDLKGVKRVLYRLPDLLARAGERVYIVEGEKDADRLVSLGLLSTTASGGAGKWREDYNETLRDREVVILPDNDDPGKKHAEQVALALHGVAVSVKVVFMPEVKDVSDYLDAGHSKEELLALIDATPVWVSELPVVKIGTEQWSATMTACWELIAPRSVYLWEIDPKRVVTCNTDDFTIVDGDNLSAMLARAARWVDRKGMPANGVPRKLVTDLLGDVVNRPPIPGIKRFVRSPLLMPNGEVVSERHYYKDCGLYYLGPPTPEPNTTDKEELVARMVKGFSTFPWRDDCSRANAFALAVAPLLTEYVSCPIPGFLISAAQQKTGKSLLVRTIHIGLTDCDVALHPLPIFDKQELQKRITTELLSEPTFIVHDNERDGSTLSSQCISGLLTTRKWRDRLFHTQRDLEIDVRSIFVVTGNNVSLDKDLSVRFVLVELQADRPDPENAVFTDPLPESMIVRSGLWRGALLRLFWQWHRDGAPKSATTFGPFTPFTQAVGGFLDWCGIEGFMGNRERTAETTEDPCDLLLPILAPWFGKYGLTASITAKDILELFKEHAPEFVDTLKKDLTPARAVGDMLKRVVGRVLRTDDGALVRLQKVRDTHTKNLRYRWQVVAPAPQKPEAEEPATADVPADLTEVVL